MEQRWSIHLLRKTQRLLEIGKRNDSKLFFQLKSRSVISYVHALALYLLFIKAVHISNIYIYIYN